MKIPKKLKICGMNYEVKTDNKGLVSDGLEGQHRPRELVIRVSTSYNPQRAEQTFFHEVLHAIDEHYNNAKLTEDEVDRLSHGLYQVLKDNNLLR